MNSFASVAKKVTAKKEKPVEGAERVPPTLQDGYLWLVRAERAA